MPPRVPLVSAEQDVRVVELLLAGMNEPKGLNEPNSELYRATGVVPNSAQVEEPLKHAQC